MIKSYKTQSYYSMSGLPSFHEGDIIKHKITRKIYIAKGDLGPFPGDAIVQNPKAGKKTICGAMITDSKFIPWWLVRLLTVKEYEQYNRSKKE